MDIPQQNIFGTTVCEWCYNVGQSRCGRCHTTFYCCRQHQVEHWPIHKKVCKKFNFTSEQPAASLSSPSFGDVVVDNFSSYGAWNQNNLPICNKPAGLNVGMGASNACVSQVEKPIDFQIPSEDEIFSSLSSELLSSDNNFWDIINSCDAQNLLDCNTDSERDEAIAKISANLQEGAPEAAHHDPGANQNLMQGATLHDICSNVVHDLNAYGICVLDKFIGSQFGTSILEEVKNLYCKGIFEKGELVNPNPLLTQESVRSDVTTWVNGTEPECAYIGSLIRKLDLVVTTCNKLQNNGLLSQYKLHRRTKAMIACYPGDGTYYKKHIDNPHKDGRCITCIYYLNQNWNIKEHGGLLQMFPSAHDSQIANIEPIFDRMLFFWSDKRNPHEVLPSYATRFAITVWYFDADERDRALLMYRDRVRKTQV